MKALVTFLVVLLLISCHEVSTDQPKPEIEIESKEVGGTKVKFIASSRSITTAELVTLRIEVSAPARTTIRFDSAPNLGSFKLFDVHQPEPKPKSGKFIHIIQYQLEPWLPGEHEIPSLKLWINEVITLLDPVTIQVKTVLPGEDAKIEDIKKIH